MNEFSDFCNELRVNIYEIFEALLMTAIISNSNKQQHIKYIAVAG